VDDPLEQFAGVYDRYYRNVLRYSLQHAEQGTAEDVTSETFLIAWRRWPDVPEPPLPWLLGVARNLLRKQAKAGRRRRLLADRIAALTREADAVGWDAGEHVVERAAALDALAYLAVVDCDPVRALRLAGAASAIRESTRSQLAPRWRELLQTVVLDPARAAAGDAADAAWAEGRAMTFDHALRYARSPGPAAD